jgi:hypothetical protein
MRKGAYRFWIIGAIVASQVLFPTASLAEDAGELKESAKQAGENRWVPSLAITGGVTAQKQTGFANSVLFEDMSPNPIPLQGFVKGDDIAVSPFVGGALELMAPALPIPTRPRLFVSGEILPTFASDRDLAISGDPGCVRGLEPDAPCASSPGGLSGENFDEDSANGQGTSLIAQIDTVVFGASLGVAFPLRIGKRQLRIKPSVGWINYEVEAEGLVVDAACNPEDRCTNVEGIRFIENPSPPPRFIGIPTIDYGYLRERTLSASGSQRFNGIGPGLDIELDTGRFGPIGSSLFLGARAYRIVDDRTISFGTERFFPAEMSDPDDPDPRIVFGPETDTARFEVKVDPWFFRAHVGIRFHWLGSEE